MASEEVKSQWINGRLKQNMREIPDFIFERVAMCILLTDKSIKKSAFSESIANLKSVIKTFLSETDLDFVSNNSQEFIDYLETNVGHIKFSKAFAVRIRPDSIRLFVEGREVFDRI